MANIKDFATTLVASAPSPALSGTTLTVQSGEGALLPAAPFYATVHPANEIPTVDNAEKIEVTSKSSDTLTVSRGLSPTTAKSIGQGWRLSNSIFVDNFTKAQVGLSNVDNTSDADKPISTATQTALSDKVDGAIRVTSSSSEPSNPNEGDLWVDPSEDPEDLKADILSTIMGVGYIYINKTDSTSPATKFGFGTWVQITDKVLMAAGSTYGANTSGGTETHSHGSDSLYAQFTAGGALGTMNKQPTPTWTRNYKLTNVTGSSDSGTTSDGIPVGGSTDSANHLPPYQTVYMWERIA